jgi:hypothetical protein
LRYPASRNLEWDGKAYPEMTRLPREKLIQYPQIRSRKINRKG